MKVKCKMLGHCYDTIANNSSNFYFQRCMQTSIVCFVFLLAKKENSTYTIVTKRKRNEVLRMTHLELVISCLCPLYEKWKRQISISLNFGALRRRIDCAAEVYKKVPLSLTCRISKEEFERISRRFCDCVLRSSFHYSELFVGNNTVF